MNGMKTLMLFVLAAACVRGDAARDIARIHTEAIGGASRLEAWRAMHATGHVTTGGKELNFELIAARPNRVRVVVRGAGRALLQATDGEAAPWRLELGTPAAPQVMTHADAREFLMDTEFDDPLASLPERGYSVDYAGEATLRGRRVFKLLVTRRDEPASVLMVDAETYFIVERWTKQVGALGRETRIETRYDDFRPVAGVIFPYRVEVYAEGRLLRETVLTSLRRIEEPLADTFRMPVAETDG